MRSCVSTICFKRKCKVDIYYYSLVGLFISKIYLVLGTSIGIVVIWIELKMESVGQRVLWGLRFIGFLKFGFSD